MARIVGNRARFGGALLLTAAFCIAGSPVASAHPDWGNRLVFEPRSLDGSGNNLRHPSWGQLGMSYSRVAPTAYVDGVSTLFNGINERYISNRIFNDLGQNIFSERQTAQWAWVWGQFLDHNMGLAQGGSESAGIAFTSTDPLESYRDDFGQIAFSRDAAASGTGTSTSNPRQQVNTVSSYLDGFAVYGGSNARLEWLREGPVDGSMANNGPHLLLDNGYLPRATYRGDASTAPTMAVDGALVGAPQNRVEAGDVRANENIALTAVHTMFVREHNRIVDSLPAQLSSEERFQIARRIVGAEIQYITYTQFLPTLGVDLHDYRGYNPDVNATISNEFATVGYRAHSMVHGEFDITVPAGKYSQDQLAAFNQQGIEVDDLGATVKLQVPLNVAFFNPDLLTAIGEGTVLQALGEQSQYRNDEQIDNSLRSVLFQVPGPDVTDPASCFQFTTPPAPQCYQGVVDLAAIDIHRARDHGIPGYNALRAAYGLPPKRSFTAITGESTDAFPSDPLIDSANPIDDPNILDFTALYDKNGNVVAPGTAAAEESVTKGVRRTPVAARLKAIYGSVDNVDAFVGMSAERHVPGSEFGELQLAIWRKQFTALRDGDRFFYQNDPALILLRLRYGLDYRRTLGQLVARNSDVPAGSLAANVFHFGPDSHRDDDFRPAPDRRQDPGDPRRGGSPTPFSARDRVR
jgi:hypothetical protein